MDGVPWVAFAQGVVRFHVLLLCCVDCFAGQASLAIRLLLMVALCGMVGFFNT